MNISWPKLIGAGIVFGIISQVLRTVEAMLTMKFYMMEEFFPVWSKIMMPTAGPPPIDFTIKSILFACVIGMIFAYVYNMIKDSVPEKGWKKGLYYGSLLFLLTTIPGTIGMYLMINLPAMLLVYWTITGLAINLVGGVAIEKIVA